MMRRIFRIGVAAYLFFALYVGSQRGLWPLFALTCSALVAMINFLWLETILVKILRPAPRVSAWRLGCRALARFTLIGVALSVPFFLAPFDGLSVLLGFSVVVAGILGEAVYVAWNHGTV